MIKRYKHYGNGYAYGNNNNLSLFFHLLAVADFTTAMRMRVMGNVAITTNVLTKANMLPSILNMIMDDFFGTKLIIIFITCCIAMAI